MVPPTCAAWTAAFGKVYNGDEVSVREAIYNANVAKIQARNERALSWTMAVDQFADLRADEFVAQYAGLSGMPMLNSSFHGEHDEVGAPPEAVDWVALGHQLRQQC